MGKTVLSLLSLYSITVILSSDGPMTRLTVLGVKLRTSLGFKLGVALGISLDWRLNEGTDDDSYLDARR